MPKGKRGRKKGVGLSKEQKETKKEMKNKREQFRRNHQNLYFELLYMTCGEMPRYNRPERASILKKAIAEITTLRKHCVQLEKQLKQANIKPMPKPQLILNEEKKLWALYHSNSKTEQGRSRSRAKLRINLDSIEPFLGEDSVGGDECIPICVTKGTIPDESSASYAVYDWRTMDELPKNKSSKLAGNNSATIATIKSLEEGENIHGSSLSSNKIEQMTAEVKLNNSNVNANVYECDIKNIRTKEKKDNDNDNAMNKIRKLNDGNLIKVNLNGEYNHSSTMEEILAITNTKSILPFHHTSQSNLPLNNPQIINSNATNLSNNGTSFTLWNTFTGNTCPPSIMLNANLHDNNDEGHTHNHRALIANLKGTTVKKRSRTCKSRMKNEKGPNGSTHEVNQEEAPLIMPQLLPPPTSNPFPFESGDLRHKKQDICVSNNTNDYKRMSSNTCGLVSPKFHFTDETNHIYDFILPKPETTNCVDRHNPIANNLPVITDVNPNHLYRYTSLSGNGNELLCADNPSINAMLIGSGHGFNDMCNLSSTVSPIKKGRTTECERTLSQSKRGENINRPPSDDSPQSHVTGSMSPVTLTTISSISHEKHRPYNQTMGSENVKGITKENGIIDRAHMYDIYSSSPHFKSSLDLFQTNDEPQYIFSENTDDIFGLPHVNVDCVVGI